MKQGKGDIVKDHDGYEQVGYGVSVTHSGANAGGPGSRVIEVDSVSGPSWVDVVARNIIPPMRRSTVDVSTVAFTTGPGSRVLDEDAVEEIGTDKSASDMDVDKVVKVDLSNNFYFGLSEEDDEDEEDDDDDDDDGDDGNDDEEDYIDSSSDIEVVPLLIQKQKKFKKTKHPIIDSPPKIKRIANPVIDIDAVARMPMFQSEDYDTEESSNDDTANWSSHKDPAKYHSDIENESYLGMDSDLKESIHDSNGSVANPDIGKEGVARMPMFKGEDYDTEESSYERPANWRNLKDPANYLSDIEDESYFGMDADLKESIHDSNDSENVLPLRLGQDSLSSSSSSSTMQYAQPLSVFPPLMQMDMNEEASNPSDGTSESNTVVLTGSNEGSSESNTVIASDCNDVMSESDTVIASTTSDEEKEIKEDNDDEEDEDEEWVEEDNNPESNDEDETEDERDDMDEDVDDESDDNDHGDDETWENEEEHSTHSEELESDLDSEPRGFVPLPTLGMRGSSNRSHVGQEDGNNVVVEDGINVGEEIGNNMGLEVVGEEYENNDVEEENQLDGQVNIMNNVFVPQAGIGNVQFSFTPHGPAPRYHETDSIVDSIQQDLGQETVVDLDMINIVICPNSRNDIERAADFMLYAGGHLATPRFYDKYPLQD
eukprot:scaffold46093_cov46-Attheya_sp.AAC.1